MGDEALAIGNLARALAYTKEEFGSMPIFVRPMVNKGFTKRTGLKLAEWQEMAREIETRVSAGESLKDIAGSQSKLQGQLEKLAENYASAPERAAKMMGRIPAILEKVKQNSAEREAWVRALIDCIAD